MSDHDIARWRTQIPSWKLAKIRCSACAHEQWINAQFQTRGGFLPCHVTGDLVSYAVLVPAPGSAVR